MINTEYKKYLETTIKALVESGEIANDITFGYNEEFYYEQKHDVEITISTLPGQINKGLVQYPVQLKIDVIDKYVDEIKTVLDDLVVSLNETAVSLDGVNYKQFYTTSTMLGSFLNNGSKKYNSLTISVTLINFSNVLGLLKLTIGGYDVLGPLVSYSIGYEAETASTGAVGTTAETKSLAKTYARTYNFVFVANTSNSGVKALLSQIIRGTSPNTTITMVSKFGTIDTNDVTESLILKTGSTEQELISTNLPLIRVILVKGVWLYG